MTLEERYALTRDAFIRFPDISDEELETIGCMRVQYLQPSSDGKCIEVIEGFESIPFELLEKQSGRVDK